jgi:hypothetical protein
MPKEKTAKNRPTKNKNAPGISLEKVVTRIQQMMDQNSTVTHNEKLEDRVGNKRQYDVVIRGRFGGRPVLGIIECKDHSRKKGPGAIEAFAKKTDNLGANLRIMVSKKGFTKQALNLAKHENIGCLSLLPEDPAQAGFSIGDMWYGVICMWTNIRLRIHFAESPAPLKTFDGNTVKWNGQPVSNWFRRELFTTYSEDTKEGDHTLELKFNEQRNIEIEGKEYPVIGITCIATRVCRKKRKWVHWSGEAFFDWHSNLLTIPPKGSVVGSAVETDLSAWSDYDGEIPEPGKWAEPGFIRAVLYMTQKWDSSKDNDVPDLSGL